MNTLIKEGSAWSRFSTSDYVKWVGEGGTGSPLLCVYVCVCVCNTLLSACTHPRLQLQIQALTMAPALLTTGLIYAIKKLIRVINSVRAKAQPGPYSQLWNCHNPPPFAHTHTHIHSQTTQRITHTQTPLCPHYERGLCWLCVCGAREVGDEEKGVNKDREKVRQSVRYNE